MEQDRPKQPLPAAIGKHAKRYAGITNAAATPLTLRTHGVEVDPGLEDYVRDRAGRKLAKFATNIERVTVRFEDENGPKGGQDIDCKIQLLMRAAPTIIVMETAAHPRDAFDLTVDATEVAVQRALEKRGRASSRSGKDGRRIRRAIQSASPSTNGASTGGRNRTRVAPKASVAFEESATARPPRKSTRSGANRVKPDAPKRLSTVVARVEAPQARRARGAHRPR